jgi:hypothetical protein
MAAGDEKKSPPSLILIILAPFGFYSIPKGTFTGPSASSAGADDGGEAGTARDLGKIDGEYHSETIPCP